MTRPISRRAFIGGAAGAGVLAAGGVTFAALLNRDPESTPSSAAPTPAPVQTPTPVPTLAPRAQGSQVITSPGAHNFDTFDAQLTGKSPVLEVLGRTHSRLLNWMADPNGSADLRFEGDLAEGWEQPDPETFLFSLHPNAKWHGRAPLNGRACTAEDVVAHFRRSLQLASEGHAPLAQRYHAYAAIEAVDSPQPGVVRFRTKGADPWLLDVLAGEFALIQAPEAVDAFAAAAPTLDSDHVIGTGPWTFDWADEGLRFTAAPGGHRQPLLETLRVVEPVSATQRFIDGQLDEAEVFDRRDGQKIRAAMAAGELVALSLPRFSRDPVMSSFFVGAAPWNNPALINAISATLRKDIVTGLFGGRAGAIGVMPFGLSGPGLSEKELLSLAGEADSPSEARSRWQAAGGPGLGAVTVDFPSIFDPLYSASSTVIDILNANLGPQFRPAVETYTTISKRVLERYYGNGRAAFWFGWGAPLASPNGPRYATDTYGAGSPGQLASGGAGARNPLDAAEVAQNGYFGIVPWAQQITETSRRPGASGPSPSPFWTQHLDYQRANV